MTLAESRSRAECWLEEVEEEEGGGTEGGGAAGVDKEKFNVLVKVLEDERKRGREEERKRVRERYLGWEQVRAMVE